MTLLSHSRSALGVELGYVDAARGLSDRAVANLLRAPLSRWGVSPKRAVLKYARDQLRAGGVEDVSSVPDTLKRLIALGECDEMYVGHESYLAPASPRSIAVGDGVVALLDVSQSPDEVTVVEGGHRDIVRRVRVETDEDAAALQVAGIREASLAEWFVPPDFFHHASRRLRRPATSDELSLAQFWDLLENTLISESLPLGDDVEIRLLGGQSGDYFGHHNATQLDGRWKTDLGQGVWCGYRQGYGESHWHPCIIAVNSDGRRALDLYDVDEWRWAVLARGHRYGCEEIVRPAGRSVQLTFPAPRQIRAAMDILGTPSSPWVWDVSLNSPDLWGLLR